jgi:MoxR-like ATPase
MTNDHPSSARPSSASEADVALARRLGDITRQLRQEMAHSIVGQRAAIDDIFITLLAGGHVLIEGVPGLAKTMIVRTLARLFDLSFARLQFTPDVMPSDITGTDIMQEDSGRRRFEFEPGPVFAQLVLGDEINRAPPKTQSALLEAMSEGSVTVGKRSMPLPQPFMVLATRNPIEQEGTYPLPEAQLDRFMMMVRIGYPSRSEEAEILHRTTGQDPPDVARLITADQLLHMRRIVRLAPVGPHVVDFAVRLVRSTRPEEDGTGQSRDFVRHWVKWGAGPRAGQALILCAKARALADGRLTPNTSDVAAVALGVLRHRLVLNFNAEAEGVTVEQVLEKLIATVAADEGVSMLT